MKTMMRCLVVVLFIGTISTQLMAQWVQTGLPNRLITTFATSGTYLFAGSDSGVYRSTDNGTSWIAANTGLTSKNISCFVVNGNNLLAGTGNKDKYFYSGEGGGGGIFISTNFGTDWNTVNNGLPKYVYNPTMFSSITSLICYGGKLFAGTYGGLCISTDNGANWEIDTLHTTIFDLFVSGMNLFVSRNPGYDRGNVSCSKDSGQTWSTVNQLNIFDPRDFSGNCFSFVVDGSNIYGIGVGSGLGITTYFIVQSTDNGDNWKINNGLDGMYSSLTTLAIAQKGDGGLNLFAGRSYNDKKILGEVLHSTNHGNNWTPVDSGLSIHSVYTLSVKGNYLFVGTDSGVWRRPLSEMIPTSVEQSSSQLPEKYSLSQNYPNPFNPSTTLRYDVPERSNVRLSIFNTLGQKISEIVNEIKDAGSYEHSFNASQLSSGIYFYRIEATSTQSSAKTFLETKKMVLMR